ncbi:unnamed protein product [Rotaria sordida]|uniref:Androglobin n=1 Tax=Rotaria sordida TaxID=392033 RepID=A0A814V4E9_9BILA|nr:unnamed protein product [Rotaria sordida]
MEREDVTRRYSVVSKLAHYSSKFKLDDNGQYSMPPPHKQSPVHSRNDQRRSIVYATLKPIENRKSRYSPLWPEWNEADVNAESWDIGSGKKKDAGTSKARVDVKSASSAGTHGFEDPEGKVELPPTLKVDQWKRPIDFLPSDKAPVIVDPDLGMLNFDLVTPNEHLHYSETMRNIIGQITALWDICRQERKTSNTTPEYTTETNPAVLSGRTWRPWEHIYALNKVSRQPFITPYNPAGKYVVRLFFLGTWRKIIVDDIIPFDSKNRCLLPQTSLSYELWPMLLSKALLKIIVLDFRSSSTYSEYNETSIIHLLTGWLPEPIPLKYTHATKVWDFLRNDRSNRLVTENDSGINKTEQQPSSPLPVFGPVPLFKWPDTKSDSSDESLLLNDQSGHPDDIGTESMTKKSDDKSAKKGGAPASLAASKDAGAKSATGKETRTGGGPIAGASKDAKKLGGVGRGVTADDQGTLVDDQTIPEAPKMIVFATIPHLEPTRISSYGETADRSERLRRYNLNDTFSTSMYLTCIRDLPLEPPPPPEYVPAWKLIRPKKPKVLPHAEPVVPQEPKPDRWIEIASPYINYPSASTLNIKPTIRLHPIDNHFTNVHTPAPGVTSRLSHSATHSTAADVPEIIEVDEEGDIESGESKPEIDIDVIQDELMSPNKEPNAFGTPETPDESVRGPGSRLKREKSADKSKINRKLAGSKLDMAGTKLSSDAVSVKSRGAESEQNLTPLDTHGTINNIEHQDSQSKINDAHSHSNIIQPIKKSYITPKIWMDFDDFCSCFTSIVVYHNPRGYPHTDKRTDIKPSVASAIKDKKKESNQPVTQQLPNLQDEKSPLYLFVDSTRERLDKNIELIVGLTSLSRWLESGSTEGVSSLGATLPTTNEKVGRGAGVSTDKTSSEISPIRGAGGRRRTSTMETLPQTPGPHVSLQDGSIVEMSQKEIIPQPSSLIAEIYSWKSPSVGQPILRLHTTTTKASFLSLPPGRHVLKFSVTCPLGYHLQVMSDTNELILGDEDQLLSKIISVPEDAEFITCAEELFHAFDDAVQNFNDMDQQDVKLNELFRSYCEYAAPYFNLTIQTCWNVFNQALYSTLRIICNGSGQPLNAETQFAWRCFTNDLITPDIMGVYEARRPSTSGVSRNSARASNAPGAGGTATATTGAPATSKKGGGGGGGGGKDKSTDDKAASKQPAQLNTSLSTAEFQEESIPDWLSHDLSINEMESIINIQKVARGFLQRRLLLARTPGTEKNFLTQRALQSTMTILKAEAPKSALTLFSTQQLIQCFPFGKDDWNMVSHKDYGGQYPEQPANTWFTIFREIFYVTEEGFVSGKFLAHVQNSLLRVINNDTYDEMTLVFNRLAPSMFTKNKFGYTFFAEGISFDQPIPTGRFRLRLLTSYTHLPEPRVVDQITSSFITKEIKDYYVPNKQQTICRYRVTVADDVNQTGRNFHLASIQFSTSKSDVLIRLTILNNNDEVVSVEGKGSVVLPAFLFMRDVTNVASNIAQALPLTQPLSRPPSKTGGTTKKDSNKPAAGNTHRGSVVESSTVGSGRSDKDRSGSDKRSRSSSRTGIMADEEEKFHKYVIQVTVLRKTWPLTPTQWQFVEQLKEQEKNELKIFNRQPSANKMDGTTGGGTGAGGKRAGQPSTSSTAAAGKGKGAAASGGAGKTGTTTSGRPGTGKGGAEKTIDTSKPHWILRVVSDGDKADELTIKKDTERNEELINMKKAWETFEAGRAQKAMKTRQKFLDSLQPKVEERPSSGTLDGTIKRPESRAGEEPSSTTTTISTTATATEQQQVAKQTSPATGPTTKKSASSAGNKKVAAKEDASKQVESISAQQELTLPQPVVDEPLLNQPPPAKPKIILPPLDVKPFIKHKMLSDEPIVLDPLFEQEDIRRRHAEFLEYAKYADEIRQYREEDHHNRYKEKIRQLEEYVDLQAKIDQSRRTINEPREAFRQRFLEVERKRLAELAAQEQELIAAAEKAKAAAAPAKDKCSGRWQVIDNLNIKLTLDWQILSEINLVVIEFRTNLVVKGFWYGFGFSSSPDKPTIGLVYALRWSENDTEVFWDIYNVTESNVIIVKQNDTSSLVTFQRLSSSGLLTVRSTIDITSFIIEQQCFYFVYMRGRFSGDIPLIPDEILFNRSLCLTCQRSESTSTNNNPTIEEVTTDLTIIHNTTIESIYNYTNKNIRLFDENISTSTSSQSSLSNYRIEYKFFWFGRILNRLWYNDYFNLTSLLSQNLRLDLQNLFLFLINHNSSYSFLCNQFELYSVQSGSILFASNISLISSLSENQTINTIEKLIKTVNNAKDFHLNFDLSAHHIKRANDILEIDVLFERFSRPVNGDLLQKVETDSTLHLLLGCIISTSCLIILTTTILCLYGYYKCRRRQFRLFTERETLKFKHDTNSYTWLGQQPSISSSSPYLIQSTSI